MTVGGFFLVEHPIYSKPSNLDCAFRCKCAGEFLHVGLLWSADRTPDTADIITRQRLLMAESTNWPTAASGVHEFYGRFSAMKLTCSKLTHDPKRTLQVRDADELRNAAGSGAVVRQSQDRIGLTCRTRRTLTSSDDGTNIPLYIVQ